LIDKAKDFLQTIADKNTVTRADDQRKDHGEQTSLDQIDVGAENATGSETTIPISKEYTQALQAMVPNSSAADRLRWILQKTMGSPDAFELRRSELKREQMFRLNYKSNNNKGNKNNNDVNVNVNSSKHENEREKEIEFNELQISDDDVVASYRSSTHPKGEMGQYLLRGKLGLCFGSAMFIHGSLPFTTNFVAEHLQKRDNNNYDDSDGDGDGYDDMKNRAESNNSRDSNSILDDKFWINFYQYAMPFAGKDKSGYDVEPVQNTVEWVDALNSFAYDQTKIWSRKIAAAEEKHYLSLNGGKKKFDEEQQPMWSSAGGYQNVSSEGKPAFGSLNQYGMGWLPFPGREKNPTVIYDSWLVEGMPHRFYENSKEDVAYRKMVCDFFSRSNIDVIVTGHQPVGDIPLTIQVPKTKEADRPKFIIAADTSYSGDTTWMDNKRRNLGRATSPSGRGDVAVTEVLMEQCVVTGSIQGVVCHGKLSDGSSYQSVDYFSDTQIGKLVDKRKYIFEGSSQDEEQDEEMEWWIKTKFLNGKYLVSSSKGYSVSNSIVSRRKS